MRDGGVGMDREKPKLPSVGPEGSKLYAQGNCIVCGVALFGQAETKRDLCGEHAAIARAVADLV